MELASKLHTWKGLPEEMLTCFVLLQSEKCIKCCYCSVKALCLLMNVKLVCAVSLLALSHHKNMRSPKR